MTVAISFVSRRRAEDAPTGTAVDDQPHKESADSDKGERDSGDQQGESSNETNAEKRPSDQSGDGTEQGEQTDGQPESSETSQRERPAAEGESKQSDHLTTQRSQRDSGESQSEESSEQSTEWPSSQLLEHSNRAKPLNVLQELPDLLGGLVGALKLVFYVVAGAFVLFLLWKHREQPVAALQDILRQLRLWLAGLKGKGETHDTMEAESAVAVPRYRRFHDFTDPFSTDKHSQVSPAELVRYTFESFEAWVRDRGTARTPDQTPLELVRIAVDPGSTLHTEARRLVKLYNHVAYSEGNVSRTAVEPLRSLWSLLASVSHGEYTETA